MAEQPSLFSTTTERHQSAAPTSSIDTRMAAMQSAEDHANESWKEEYESFLLQFADCHDVFASEDVQFAYKALPHLPQPHEWRASGGITQRLIRQGKLYIIGSRKSGVDCRKINVLSRRPGTHCPTCGRDGGLS